VGKTAAACMLQSGPVGDPGSRPDCVGLPGLNVGVAVVMKPCSSAPNIDLLHHTESGRALWPNKAEDSLQNRGIDKQQSRSIPELVVISGSSENISLVETFGQPHEPDIVQSTKSSSLPRHGALLPVQPVAPPRRKKTKTPSPSSANAPEEVFFMSLVLFTDVFLFICR